MNISSKIETYFLYITHFNNFSTYASSVEQANHCAWKIFWRNINCQVHKLSSQKEKKMKIKLQTANCSIDFKQIKANWIERVMVLIAFQPFKSKFLQQCNETVLINFLGRHIDHGPKILSSLVFSKRSNYEKSCKKFSVFLKRKYYSVM